MDVNFGTNVTNCSILFDSSPNANYGFVDPNSFRITGNNWNGRVSLPYGITKFALNNSARLNSDITIPNTVTNTGSAFKFCGNFNQNINIPDSVTYMASMFTSCFNLNANIHLSNNAIYINDVFTRCFNLDQNIHIPDSVLNMAAAFTNCYNLNQNIQIPWNVNSMSHTFDTCNNLNQNIKISNSVTTLYAAFANCKSLCQNILIPSTVANVSSCFVGCNNLSDVTVQRSTRTYSNYSNFVRNNASKQLNIWTDEVTVNNLTAARLVQGGVQPEFTAITNGYYNAVYNLYLYTNTVFE